MLRFLRRMLLMLAIKFVASLFKELWWAVLQSEEQKILSDLPLKTSLQTRHVLRLGLFIALNFSE